VQSPEFRHRKYLFVRRALPKAMLDYLKAYCRVLLENGRFGADSQCPLSLGLAGDPGLDAVLEWIRPRIGRLVGCPLTPTYSFARLYAEGEVLNRHRDRAACEISVTLSIEIPKGGGPSVLFLKPPRQRIVAIEMQEGDGCIYAGTEVEHWREAISVGGYLQLFLHFIETNGQHYPHLAFDGRKSLGGIA
jgi:hypothetical protein